MTLELDDATRRALPAEIKRRIPDGTQKNLAPEIAKALGTSEKTESARVTKFLQGDPGIVANYLSPDRIELVLDTICRELGISRAELLKAAHASGQDVPDRLPAWSELGERTPWLDAVPGLARGTETIGESLRALPQRSVIWLFGAPGSGKTAWLYRAERAGIGGRVEGHPEDAPEGVVWLVDEPAQPGRWIEWAERRGTSAILSTATRPKREERVIELAAWGHAEARAFLDQLDGAALEAGGPLAAADLIRIGDVLSTLAIHWTPFDLGHVLRLLIDEPALLDRTTSRELHLRSKLHRLERRVPLQPHLQAAWKTHGRRAIATAAAAAIRAGAPEVLQTASSEDGLRAALAPVAGASADSVSLRAWLERAEQEVATAKKKDRLAVLERWAATPSAADLVDMLVEAGVWSHAKGDRLEIADVTLALALAPEAFNEEWTWRTLLATFGDREWRLPRRYWAAHLGDVQRRIDELLASTAVVHPAAIELAIGIVAFAEEDARADQVITAIGSAMLLQHCGALAPVGIAPDHETVSDALAAASRRYRRILPQLTTASGREEFAALATPTARRIVAAVDAATASDGFWGHGRSHLATDPAWWGHANMLPWQAFALMTALETRESARFLRVDRDRVILDFARDGDPHARAIATGDLEDNDRALQVSAVAMLSAIEAWGAPADPDRHLAVLFELSSMLHDRRAPIAPRYHRRLVEAIIGFVRRHPEHRLQYLALTGSWAPTWREALHLAGATKHLRAWFEWALDTYRSHSRFVMRDKLEWPAQWPEPPHDELIALAEILHRHGDREPLRGLLGDVVPLPARPIGPPQLAVDAALALLRRRDREPLRDALDGRGSRGDAVSAALFGTLDDATEEWVADVLGEGFDAYLRKLEHRPEKRDLVRRWAADPSHQWRRDRAAVWLLEHPVLHAEETALIEWLFTTEPIASARHHAPAGLAHPDPAIQSAAAALLDRAIAEVAPGDLDLTRVVGSFSYSSDADREIGGIWKLTEYLRYLADSERSCSPSAAQTMIGLLQRRLGDERADADVPTWLSLCGALAALMLRRRLPGLAAWVRSPLGERTDAPGQEHPATLVRDVLGHHVVIAGVPIERDVLEAVAEIAPPFHATGAHERLLELARVSDDDVFDEWSRATDEVLVDASSAPPRWYAVMEIARTRDPRRYARVFTDRLLALPASLRPRAVLQIGQILPFDPAQATRLSALFD